MARQALVADAVSQRLPCMSTTLNATRDALLGGVRLNLARWLGGVGEAGGAGGTGSAGDAAPDVLAYDTTWGGLVYRSALDSPGFAFGNGVYSDHHLHYGGHVGSTWRRRSTLLEGCWRVGGVSEEGRRGAPTAAACNLCWDASPISF
eukprot:102670-Chlamydomonas_euryale.AAC.1